MNVPWIEGDRIAMLTADDAKGYVDRVSRLIEDPAFYDEACTATRDFVASRPGEREYISGVDRNIAEIVRATRSRLALND